MITRSFSFVVMAAILFFLANPLGHNLANLFHPCQSRYVNRKVHRGKHQLLFSSMH